MEFGSSLRITSVHIAAVMAPSGRLICVEANPQLLPGLRQRILPRAPKVRIDVVHAALTDHCGTGGGHRFGGQRRGPAGGNHLIKDLKALAGLGVFLLDARLLDRSLGRLTAQLAVQILPAAVTTSGPRPTTARC